MVTRHRTGSGSTSTRHDRPLGYRVWRVDEPASMSSAHTHPDVEINWFASGSLEYLLAGRRVRLNQSELGIFWGGVPHQMSVAADQPPREGVWVTLPLAWLFECHLPRAFVARLMSGQMITQPMQADRPVRWLTDFELGGQAMRFPLLELQAILGRAALRGDGSVAAKRRSPDPTGDSHVERVIAHLAMEYQNPISCESIAAAVGLHPKYLMTVFKRSSGVTINSYLTRLRIAHAQCLLLTTNLPVIQIAGRCGYGSLAAFYEAFNRHAGQRPLQYRRQNRGSV
jgi:AraC family transcriptional regulator, melibiose operon regulatory protein